MLAIENGVLYTPTGTIADGAILADGPTIISTGARGEVEIPPGTERLDARGGHIGPGFIDMHIHGALGCDLMSATPEQMARLTALLPGHGVTAFVPTTVTAPVPAILGALDTVRSIKAAGQLRGAEILGVHVEGPFLNPEQKGAHRAELLHAPDAGECAQIIQYADIIRWVTLAPELPGAIEFIRALRERGIVISAGHTMAIEPQMERAIAAGLSHVTHLYGNMNSLRRENMTRVAGTTEMALLDDRLTAEIIGDGYHISPGLMRLALKTKGVDRLAIVTDASPLMGLPPGHYQLWGIEVLLEEDVSYLPDRSAFAGSVAPMDRCVRNVIRMAGVSLADAFRMASTTPARILGVHRRKGSLASGMDADVVILDNELHVAHTLVRGELFSSAEGVRDSGHI